MRKVKIVVGGGRSNRLVYWAYTVYGDVWSGFDRELTSHGFKFLKRRDRLGVLCYLYGLRSALEHLIREVEAKNIRSQYLIRFYCSNDNLFRVLSRWGYELKDPLTVEVVNSVRRLVNRIGLLDLVRSTKNSLEKELKKIATLNFYRRLNEVLENSRTWQFSDKLKYVVYQLPEDSKDIPLNFLATYIFNKKERRKVDGVIVFRKDGTVTKAFFYDTTGRGKIVDNFREADRACVDEWLGTYKAIYVTLHDPTKVEDILVEVAEKCSALATSSMS